MKDIIMKEVKDFIKNETIREETGHDWWHIERVYNNAMLINEKEKANKDMVGVIALFHDLYDYKFFDGNIRDKLLENFQKLKINMIFSKEEIDNIIYSCENISFSKNIENKKKLSKEGLIVQDADRLDSIGAIAIARTFSYGGKVKRPIYNPELTREEIKSEHEYKKKKSDSIGHFYDKLLKLKDLLNTKAAREIAIHRHKYMEEFLEEFYKEWNGKC